MEFYKFRDAVAEQFEHMKNYRLYVTDTNKDELWQTYLDSFPPGTNPIFRERTEHDCQTCKSFIRQVGNIVAIDSVGNIMSIWDVSIPGFYQTVADAMSAYVKGIPIKNRLLKTERKFGAHQTVSMFEDELEKWSHFYLELPDDYVIDSDAIGHELSQSTAAHDVFKRGLETITDESLDIVLDLIAQNSLYRGEEYRQQVQSFAKLKRDYKDYPDRIKVLFPWQYCFEYGAIIRNTVIGTLLVDISEGTDLQIAVYKYLDKVAPENFKRPKSIISKKMIKAAQDQVANLGLQDSLARRFAVTDDLTINNVLYADKKVKQSMDVFDELAESIPDKSKSLDHAEEITIADFMTNVLPKISKMELMLETDHVANLMSLIAPVNPDAPNITKWNNNFTWTYNGDITDSRIKEKVKARGGDTTGPLRFSINWAEGDWSSDNSDLDAWAIEPSNRQIGYSEPFMKSKGKRSPCSGQLDVDIQLPREYHNEDIVENIVWTDKNKMQDGIYVLWVDQYCGRGSRGFKAEVEIEGKIYSYLYDRSVVGQIHVADIILENGNFTIKHRLPLISETTQAHWNINTNKFHTVNMLMHSPNHWDEQNIGNRHYFFILEGCLNPDTARGFYNEFLPQSLHDHRKVFEVLGSKMRVEHSENQLSGLGFSTTKRNHVICKVSGSFNRMLKIQF